MLRVKRIVGNRIESRLAGLLGGVLMMLALTLALSRTAHAQDAGAFYLDRAQLSGAPDDPFMTWRPTFFDKPRFYGSAAMGYSLNPLRISTLTERQRVSEDADNPFRHQLIMYLQAGLQLNRRLAFDVSLPIALVNAGGDDPLEYEIGSGMARGIAVMDARLGLRAMALESDDRRFRWGGGLAVFVPSGNSVRFTSDDQTTAWVFTNMEYDFGDLLWVGMIGPHFRPRQGPRPSQLQAGRELRLSTGLFVPLRSDRLRVGAELWGQTGIDTVRVTERGYQEEVSSFFRSENTSFEWLAQARLLMGSAKDWYIMGGGGTRFTGGYGAADLRVLVQVGSHILLSDVNPDSPPRKVRVTDRKLLEPDPDTDGDGFPDPVDQCPTIKEDGKEPYPDDGCPDLDRDNDGILDADDKCPTVPEDKDGIEDEDGCPEEDADKDGILDVEDACPTVKGVKHQDPKKHGCPAEKKIVVTESEIELLEPIQFEYNEATILPVSFGILDQIVDLMRERPSVRLGIYGHTDNRGGANYNKQLSRRRAASVVQYLVDKGISRNRLESEGYGMERPRATNATEEGRAKNRRVEFKILAQ